MSAHSPDTVCSASGRPRGSHGPPSPRVRSCTPPAPCRCPAHPEDHGRSPLHRGPGDRSGGTGRGRHSLAANSGAASGAGEQSARRPASRVLPLGSRHLFTLRTIVSSCLQLVLHLNFSTYFFSCERGPEQGEGWRGSRDPRPDPESWVRSPDRGGRDLDRNVRSSALPTELPPHPRLKRFNTLYGCLFSVPAGLTIPEVRVSPAFAASVSPTALGSKTRG